MRALIKDRNSVALREIARPVLRAGNDVLIRIKLAGLCRTDVFVAEGKIKCKDGLVLGHEFSGIIERTGPAANTFLPGDRVTVMPIVPCDACAFCTSNRRDKCQNTSMLGVDHDGAFAEYIVVPAGAVYKLPDNVSFKQGAYSEPVAASLSVIKAGIQPEQQGLIYGDNRFGQLLMRILKAYNFRNLTLYDPASGKALPDNTFDFVVETMATEQVMSELLRTVVPGGRIVLKSRKYEPIGINFGLAVKKEITFSAVNYGDFAEAIRLVADGRLKIDDLLGDIHELEDFAPVFERSKGFENTKMFFKPGKDAL